MPVCDGCEATRMIRRYLDSQQPSIVQPLIVCLTNCTAGDEQQQAFNAGFDMFQEKPIFKREILRILSKAKLLQSKI